LTDGVFDGFGGPEKLGDDFFGFEGFEVRVGPGVDGDLVVFLEHAADQVWVICGVATDDKEGRLDFVSGEKVEDASGVFSVFSN
jgi:hypothetical protein